MTAPEIMPFVRAHGRTTFSFQALNHGMKHWIHDDACLAYTEVGGAWVTVGSPLTSPEREHERMEHFVAEAQRRRKRARFFGVEGEVPESSSLRWLKLGEQPVWNPQRWPQGVGKKVRGQLRRARANRIVRIREASPAELLDPSSETRRGMNAVIEEWLMQRRMAPMGFLVGIRPFHIAQERRFFLAESGGEIVAALVAIPIYARGGWFLDNMLRTAAAPNGAVELLFDEVMQRLASEGCTHVTFGVCPLMNATHPLLRRARQWGARFYNFEGLQRFKTKLGPCEWQPVYLVHPARDSGLLALVDAGRAFFPRGLFRFLWDTAVHQTTLVLGVLAPLLGLAATLLWSFAPAPWFDEGVAGRGALLGTLGIAGALALLIRGARREAIAGASVLSAVLGCAWIAHLAASRCSWSMATTFLVAGFGSWLLAAFLWSARNRFSGFDRSDQGSAPELELPPLGGT